MSWEAYVQYWRITLLTLVEYRANFFMWFAFTFVYHAVAFGAVWITLTQFPSMNGWRFDEMALLYALWMLGHGLHNTIFWTIGDVPTAVREGRFDRFLVRPLDPLFQALTVPQQVWPDELFMAIVFVCIATALAHITVTPGYVLFVILVAIGGALIDFGINLAIATASFWFVRVDALRWVVMSLEQEFTRYPITIYAKPVRIALTFVVPFAFMNFFPAAYVLQKSDVGFGLSPAVGLLTPLVGLVAGLAAYLFWRVGLTKYTGTGS